MSHIIKILIGVLLLSSGYAYAVQPKRVGDCAEYRDRYQATEEAKTRFAGLEGTCEGIYDIDGVLYARAQAVIRSNRSGTVRLYLPATDKTIEAKPDQSGYVYVGGQKIRVRNLNRGDEIGIYLHLDKFFTEKVSEVAFATADTDEAPITIAPVTEVSALPTTASPVPALALVSGLFLAAGLFVRGLRRSA